jgi:hypothetical protein
MCVLAVTLRAASASAHDLERTQVLLTFDRDGSFVLDVANDPNWLKLRLERFPTPFADRVVLWVDGREIRPSSVEFLAPEAGSGSVDRLAIYRMRGRMPAGARTLRWYYGLVIDPYPLIVRRADGRVVVEEVAGDAWSRAIDLSGQIHGPIVSTTIVGVALMLVLALPIALRLGFWRPG